jgi:hypothetical protein
LPTTGATIPDKELVALILKALPVILKPLPVSCLNLSGKIKAIQFEELVWPLLDEDLELRQCEDEGRSKEIFVVKQKGKHAKQQVKLKKPEEPKSRSTISSTHASKKKGTKKCYICAKLAHLCNVPFRVITP